MERPDRPGYAAAARDALAGRLLDSTLGFMDPCTVCLGDRLGLYGALDGQAPPPPESSPAPPGPTSTTLGKWLEQPAVAGFIRVDDVAAAAETLLPAGHAEVLVDPDNHLVPFAQLGVGVTRSLPAPPSARRRERDRRERTGPRSSTYSGRNGARRSPMSMPGCSPIPPGGRPMSPAEPVGRRSASRVPTRRFAWTGSISTRRR